MAELVVLTPEQRAARKAEIRKAWSPATAARRPAGKDAGAKPKPKAKRSNRSKAGK